MTKKKQTVPAKSPQVKSKQEKLRELRQSTLVIIEKEFGKGLVFTQDTPRLEVECLPVGLPSLDNILGGGFARGRISEIFGPEGGGKSTLALNLVAETQRKGGVVAYVDAEHEFLLEQATNMGVNMDDLLVSQPNGAEESLSIVDLLVRSGNVDLVIIDSVAALTPKAEIEGKMTDQQVGLQARIMSKFFRKTKAIINTTNTHVCFINQIRMKVGVIFGNPETTPGGNALKFFAGQRMEVRRAGPCKEGEEVIGNNTKIKCIKNKIAPPFRECKLDLIFGQGFDKYGDILDIAVDNNIVDKAGAWYSYDEKRLGQGRRTVANMIRNDSKLCEEIEKKITGATNVSTRDNDNNGVRGDGE